MRSNHSFRDGVKRVGTLVVVSGRNIDITGWVYLMLPESNKSRCHATMARFGRRQSRARLID